MGADVLRRNIVGKKTFVLSINICAKNSTLRQAANR